MIDKKSFNDRVSMTDQQSELTELDDESLALVFGGDGDTCLIFRDRYVDNGNFRDHFKDECAKVEA